MSAVQPMRVLTPALAAQLAALNRAHRQLRAAGYSVLRHVTRPNESTPPVIELAASDARLPYRLGRLVTVNVDGTPRIGVRLCAGDDASVDVVWRQSGAAA